MRTQLHTYYNEIPGERVWYPTEVGVSRRSNILVEGATFYAHILQGGCRIVPIRQALSQSPRSALVKVDIFGKSYHGEVLDVFEHTQRGYGSTMFAEMRWLKTTSASPVTINNWLLFPEHDVVVSEYDRYMPRGPTVPPTLIPMTWIRCHLARLTFHDHKPKLWLTISLEKQVLYLKPALLPRTRCYLLTTAVIHGSFTW
ncbi:hypothetical protein JB92DRAFT_3141851 [Gautieria morchelliformis]|nr:hypothetical protein JB92DRAFT_3141851 [Gautieria morchelliformis]